MRYQTVVVVIPLVSAIVYRQLVRYRAKVAQRRTQSMLVTAVDRMMLDLRSGSSLAQACGALADHPAEHLMLMPLATAIRSRRTLLEAASALASSPAGRSNPSVRLISVTLEILALNGGPALPSMQRLRHTLVGLVYRGQQTDAESSQALASAALMALAPAAFVVAMIALDPRLADFYLNETLGTACVVAASGLAYAGWHWMERIVSAEDSPSW